MEDQNKEKRDNDGPEHTAAKRHKGFVEATLSKLSQTTDALEWFRGLSDEKESSGLAALDPDNTIQLSVAIARGIELTMPVHRAVFTEPHRESAHRFVATLAYAMSVEFGTDFVAVGTSDGDVNEGLVARVRELLLSEELGDVRETLAPVDYREVRYGIANYAAAASGGKVRVISLDEVPQQQQKPFDFKATGQNNPRFPGRFLGVDIGAGSAKFALLEGGKIKPVPDELRDFKTIIEKKETGTDYVARFANHVKAIQDEVGVLDGVGIDMPGAADIPHNRMVTLGQITVKKKWGDADIEQVHSLVPATADAIGLSHDRVMVRNDMDGVLAGVLAILPEAKPEFWDRTDEGTFRFDWMGSGHGHQFAVNGTAFPGPTEGGHVFVDFGRPGETIYDTEARTSIPALLTLAKIKGIPLQDDEFKPIGLAAADKKAEYHHKAMEVLSEFAKYYARNLIVVYEVTRRTGTVNAMDVLLGGGITRGKTGDIILDLTLKELKHLGYDKVFHIELLSEDELEGIIDNHEDIGPRGSASMIQTHVQSLPADK